MKQLIHNAFFFLFQLLPVAEIMGHVSFSDISSLSLSSDKHSVMSLKEGWGGAPGEPSGESQEVERCCEI